MNTVAFTAPSAQKLGLPREWIVAIFAAVAISMLSASPLIGLSIVGAYLVALRLLWQSTESQALVFALSYQWIQVFASVVQSFLDGASISERLGGEHFEMAAVLSGLGLVFWAIGIKLAIFNQATFPMESLAAGLRSIKLKKLNIAWVAFTILNLGLTQIGGVISGISQAISALLILKWLIVFLIFQRWMVLKEGGMVVLFVFLIEVGVGMTGFFSSFKMVFFVCLTAASGVTLLSGKLSNFSGLLAVLLMFVLLIWQGIKGSYREFLNQGERSQAVSVSLVERVKWLGTNIIMLNGESLAEGWTSGLRRVVYIEYFGHSIKYVPAMVPHTTGQLWWEAVKHPLTPRMLFPNKSAIHDSDRTNAFTGQVVAGYEEGTSVSIGYIGESYIDFGKFLMFAPILLWGGVVGLCYKVLRRNAPHPILGSGLASCWILSQVMYLESSNIKLVGGVLSSFLVLLVFLRSCGPIFWCWLSGEANIAKTEPNSK
jgi:hypothetical protein